MKEKILNRFDELITQGNAVLSTKQNSSFGSYVNSGKFIGFCSGSLSFLEKLFGSNHTYCKSVSDNMKSNDPLGVEIVINILYAAKKEVEGGWLSTIEGQMSADIFADFVVLAKNAMDGNKDVAAVLACAALEDALKRLAKKQGLAVDDKEMTDVINALKSNGTIQGPQATIVQSYVKLRNKAFHAEWDKIDKESVSSLIGFTEQFLITNFT